MSTATDREQAAAFFYEHAGYCYPTGSDEAAQEYARQESARWLAEAEETAARRGWWWGVEDDWDDCSDPDDDGQTAAALEAGTLQRLTVFLSDSSSRVLASLGGVIVEDERGPYVRVVAAELAADLLAGHRECGARTTCGACGHAWCGLCDPAPSALCHWCHGRGHSTAELQPAYEMEQPAPMVIRHTAKTCPGRPCSTDCDHVEVRP